METSFPTAAPDAGQAIHPEWTIGDGTQASVESVY